MRRTRVLPAILVLTLGCKETPTPRTAEPIRSVVETEQALVAELGQLTAQLNEDQSALLALKGRMAELKVALELNRNSAPAPRARLEAEMKHLDQEVAGRRHALEVLAQRQRALTTLLGQSPKRR